MATAKQIAARKLFVKRVKAGEFKRGAAKKKAVKRAAKNPVHGPTIAKRESGNVWLVSDGVTSRRITAADKYDAVVSFNATRKPNPARKKAAPKAIKRTGISKTAYVKRPSQATATPPTKRLKARRKAAGVPGYFPNPKSAALPYLVESTKGAAWKPMARFATFPLAKQYAHALHRTTADLAVRVTDVRK